MIKDNLALTRKNLHISEKSTYILLSNGIYFQLIFENLSSIYLFLPWAVAILIGCKNDCSENTICSCVRPATRYTISPSYHLIQIYFGVSQNTNLQHKSIYSTYIDKGRDSSLQPFTDSTVFIKSYLIRS